MIVFYVKTKKLLSIVFITLAIGFLCAFFLFSDSTTGYDKDANVSTSVNKLSTDGFDNVSQISFLSQFGWEVETCPLDICQITIPVVFNDTYKQYNLIQKSQGFNLEKYKGKTCDRITYKVLNYNGDSSNVRANLIVMKGKVIGGDICSTQLDGFMHGFKRE